MQTNDPSPGALPVSGAAPVTAPGAASTTVLPLRATAGLWSGWTLLAAMANAAGWIDVLPRAGAGLAAGALLLVVLAAGLARRPQGRAAGRGLVLAGAGLALAAGFLATAGGLADRAAAVLAAGMALSTVLAAAPLLPGRWVARCAGAALVALPLADVLRSLGLDLPLPAPGALALPAAAFALVLVALVAGAAGIAAERQRLERQRERLADDLRRVTHHVERDQLTNSFSRRHIIEMLTREMARTDRTGEFFCVCLLDLDHFKALNDNHGHLTGDRILASFARRVRGELRSMDTVNRAGVQSALGRVGGEEFLVILPHTTLKGALRVAERMRQAVNERPLDGQHAVTVSIGIAEYRGSETVGGLLGRADKALYGAKRGGRNRVHCASREGSTAQVVMPDIPRSASRGQ